MAVSPGCSDYVKRCFWGHTEFQCNQSHEYLSFIPTTAYLGPCCSFNYNPRNASFVPFSANIFGMDGGLTFVGAEGSERNLNTGLIVLVHHPMDYVTESAASVTITARSESFVEVSPTVQSSSVEVLELSERKRDCLISDDLRLRNYRQAACLLACQTEAIVEKCGCHPYLLPIVGNKFKECNLNDTFCYSANYGEWSSPCRSPTLLVGKVAHVQLFGWLTGSRTLSAGSFVVSAASSGPRRTFHISAAPPAVTVFYIQLLRHRHPRCRQFCWLMFHNLY